MAEETFSGPPQTPNQTTPPPMPNDKSSAPVDDISIETENDPLDEAIAGVPRVAGILLAAEVVMLLSGLLVPTSVLLTVPVMTILGFWMVAIGVRISGKLNFVQRLASRMGQFSIILQGLGLSPLLLMFFGVVILHNSAYRIQIRILAVIYSVFFVPAVLLVRTQAMRHFGKRSFEVSRSELVRLGASVGIAVVLISGLFYTLGSEETQTTSQRDEDSMIILQRKEQIAEAHRLWDADNHFEAVSRYKSLLNPGMTPWYRLELMGEQAMVYRRVIDHEAEYGDPGSARDWALRAYEEGRWNSPLRKMTFSSDSANTIWEDVVQASQNDE